METERQIREMEKAMTTTDNRRLYERCLAVSWFSKAAPGKKPGTPSAATSILSATM